MRTYYRIDYRIPGYFYQLTAYDLESPYEEDIREAIAVTEGCDPDEIELLLDTLNSYKG